ncbi:Uu.00g003140.m01.CDS01 [Anthostomella pinea]|uniref:Uu.00g003140.m01.CDS01 n=1 Tax=Anthostomella pinea TaxID=933095 RepID=A0AAI8VJR5_9PEZI|nr:Uu.00g003140.m01.CDS01 [Anthostomella pinea]
MADGQMGRWADERFQTAPPSGPSGGSRCPLDSAVTPVRLPPFSHLWRDWRFY